MIYSTFVCNIKCKQYVRNTLPLPCILRVTRNTVQSVLQAQAYENFDYLRIFLKTKPFSLIILLFVIGGTCSFYYDNQTNSLQLPWIQTRSENINLLQLFFQLCVTFINVDLKHDSIDRRITVTCYIIWAVENN